MPKVMALKCPVCGAPVAMGATLCAYCGSALFIMADAPSINLINLNNAVIQEHIADFRQRVRKNPNDEAAHYGLGIAYFNLGLYEESILELKHAAILMPESADIQSQLCVAVNQEAKSRGIPYFSRESLVDPYIKKTLLLDSLNVDANLVKVEFLCERGLYREASETLQRIEHRDPARIAPKLPQIDLLLKTWQDETTTEFNYLLKSNQWNEAANTIFRLSHQDEQLALRLAVVYLRKHERLLKRTIKTGPGVRIRSKSTASLTGTVGVLIKGILLGIVQYVALFFLSLYLYRDAVVPASLMPYKGTPFFWPLAIIGVAPIYHKPFFALSLALVVILPIILVWRYRRSEFLWLNSGLEDMFTTSQRISKSDVLSGKASPESILFALRLVQRQVNR